MPSKLIFRHLLFIAVILSFFQGSSSKAQTSNKWYSIQAGSFFIQEDAENLYNTLDQELAPSLKDGLRVEYISSYFTVRVGKVSTRQELAPYLFSLKYIVPVPLIVHDTIQNNRIISQNTPLSQQKVIAPQEKAPDQTSPIQRKSPAASQTQNSLSLKPKLYFTVQLGSYTDERDAIRYYEDLSQKLPAEMRSYLRVERISFFYTVRVGKSLNGQDIMPIFQEAKKYSTPAIFKANVLENRIMRIYNPADLEMLQTSRVIAKAEPPAIAPNIDTPPTSSITSEAKTQKNEITAQKSSPTLPEGPSSQKYIGPVSTPSTETEPGKIDLLSENRGEQTLEYSRELTSEKKPVSSVETSQVQKTQKADEGLKESQTEQVAEKEKLFIQPDTSILGEIPPIPPEELAGIIFMPMSLPPMESELFEQSASQKTIKKPLVTSPVKLTAKKAAPSVKLEKPNIEDLTQKLITKYLEKSESVKKKDDQVMKLAESFKESPDCLSAECHAGMASQPVGHFPVKSGRCKACHTKNEDNHPGQNDQKTEFTLTVQGKALCNQCHSPFAGNTTHAPLEEEEPCLTCHSPHGSQYPTLLIARLNGPNNLCMGCHKSSITDYKYQHGPVGIGECTFCHNPHSSSQNFLLKTEQQELCFRCHENVAIGLKELPHVHSVVTKEGCTSCHNPHGSNFPNLLSQKGETFCLSCHEEISEKYYKSRFKHDGMYLEQQCSTCHFAHSSQYKSLLNKKELDLCMSCHSERNQVKNKSPRNIELELKKSYLHKPVEEGQCSLCHDSHGSKNASLLTGQYPGSFYSPYEPDLYDLCFSCHARELLTLKETDYFTNFRNGTKNLHYTHVAIDRKGRTCQACHQAHASNGPKLINSTGASFGAWQMSIEFSINVKGGSCMPGCHREMSYNRNEPINNSVKEGSYGKYYIEYEDKN